MTRATLTAKMALTAKMRDCSRFMAWIHLLPKWRPTRAHKKSRTQFLLSETSGSVPDWYNLSSVVTLLLYLLINILWSYANS